MNSIVYLQGIGVSKYFKVGNRTDFLKSLKHSSLPKLKLEELFLRYQAGKPCAPEGFHDINDFFAERGIGEWSGLFLDTSWYKHTYFVGCAGTKNQSYFFKVFKKSGDAEQEANKLEKIRPNFSSGFRIPDIIHRGENILVTNYIEPYGHPKPTNAREAILESINKSGRASSRPLDALLNDFKYSLELIKQTGLLNDHLFEASLIDKFSLDKSLRYSQSLCHGDLTPWNTFRDKENKTVLVDTERVDIRAIYTDLFHYEFQTKAMSRCCFYKIEKIMSPIVETLSMDYSKVATLALLYLCEEIVIDSHELLNRRNNSNLIIRALTRKMNWAKNLIQHFDPLALTPHE